MSEIENNEAVEFAPEEEFIDPIEVIYMGECPSLSGRSTLTFAIGRHSEDGKLHLAITGNSGRGMHCSEFCSASSINEIVLGATELTAKSFHPLHAGRSINTGGFVLAALKELGLIRANEQNGRLHEHCPTTSFQQLVMARISGIQPVTPKRRKAKEID